MFYDFYTECEDSCLDNSTVSRWIKGNRPVPAAIVNYYRENGAESSGDSFQEIALKSYLTRSSCSMRLLRLYRTTTHFPKKRKMKYCLQT